MNLLFLASVFLVLIIVFVLMRKMHQKKQIQEVLQQQEALALVRRDAVLKELDILGDLIHDSTLTPEAISKRANASFTIIEANNIDGMFTELIKDTKDYISNELNRKREPKTPSN